VGTQPGRSGVTEWQSFPAGAKNERDLEHKGTLAAVPKQPLGTVIPVQAGIKTGRGAGDEGAGPGWAAVTVGRPPFPRKIY